MNKRSRLMCLALVLSVAMWSPAALLAGEHGGTEHGGKEVEGGHGHDEGSHGSHEKMAEYVSTLKEAAAALKKDGHAELAAELESMVKMKEEKMVKWKEKKKD